MTSMAAQDSGDSTPQPSSWVEIARVARAHGLSGSLLITLHSDDPANLLGASRVLLEGSGRKSVFELERAEANPQKTGARSSVRVWLRGLSGRDAAESWAGATVSISEAEIAELPEGELYWRDLIGATLRRADGTSLGRVEEIWPTAAHDVLVVRDGERTRLLPARQDAFVRFDRAERTLWVDFDLEDEEPS